MVRGVGIAVTAVYGTYQCAEMATTARGFGIDVPMFRHARVYSFSARAFMGLPCPTKIAGRRGTVLTTVLREGWERSKYWDAGGDYLWVAAHESYHDAP